MRLAFSQMATCVFVSSNRNGKTPMAAVVCKQTLACEKSRVIMQDPYLADFGVGFTCVLTVALVVNS